MKTRTIKVRATPDEHKALKEKAKTEDQTMSDFLMVKSGVRKLPKP